MEAVLSPGAVFHGKYEVRRCLKVGGMAVVYEVVHAATRRPAALKVLLPDILSEGGMRERFELEARITAGVESGHIVQVLDAGIDASTGSAFLVMELLRGDDLETVLRRRGALEANEVIVLLSQAARALDAVHAARIVHRDLKPSNLFLVEEGGRSYIKVLDFGIAKIVSSGAHTTRNLGTPAYMSPEQVRGDAYIDAAADVYSLGQMAFTLLVGAPYWGEECAASGRALFDAIERGTVEAASVRAAKRRVALPAAFDAWFAKATASEPDDRFETAGELVDALAASFGVSQTVAPTVQPPLDRRARRWSARAMAAWIVAIGVVSGTLVAVRAIARARDGAVHRVAVEAPPSAHAEPSVSEERPIPVPTPSATPAQARRAPPVAPRTGGASARPPSTGAPMPAISASASAAARVAPPPSPRPFGTSAF